MIKLELSQRQLDRINNGEMIKAVDLSDKVYNVAMINGVISAVKVDATKPAFKKVVLATSSADTLTLTNEETKEYEYCLNNKISTLNVYRSSGAKITLAQLETIKAQLTETQYNTDKDYIASGKVASLQAQKALNIARKVVVAVSDNPYIVSDTNASVSVIDTIELL